MSTNYKIEQLITEEERAELRELFNTLDPQLAHQDYNLFDVDKRDIHPKQWNDIIQKISARGESEGLTTHAHYFVMYGKDAFTRIHTDDDKVIKLTIITMIETKDLVGGGSLIYDKYNRKPRPAFKYAKRTGNGHGPYGRDIIPVIVETKDGESMIYDGKTLHGVTQVQQGHRLVLVSWFK